MVLRCGLISRAYAGGSGAMWPGSAVLAAAMETAMSQRDRSTAFGGCRGGFESTQVGVSLACVSAALRIKLGIAVRVDVARARVRCGQSVRCPLRQWERRCLGAIVLQKSEGAAMARGSVCAGRRQIGMCFRGAAGSAWCRGAGRCRAHAGGSVAMLAARAVLFRTMGTAMLQRDRFAEVGIREI